MGKRKAASIRRCCVRANVLFYWVWFFLLVHPNVLEGKLLMPTRDPGLDRLDFLVGDWDLTCKFFPGPNGGPEQTTKGKAQYRWGTGGQWLTYDSTLNTPGTGQYEVHGLVGYDPARQRYPAFAFNSIAPRGIEYMGEWIDETTLVFTSVTKTARSTVARVVYAQLPDGKVRFSSEESTRDGSFKPYFEAILTRRETQFTSPNKSPLPPANADEPRQMARLYRIVLPVGDFERAVVFYRTLLASDGRRVSPGRHYFDCGEVILALVDPRADGDSSGARPNADHIYLAVADLEEFHRRAEKVGGLSRETGDGGLPMGQIARRPWGERSFYMKDPFDNPLCFVDEKTLFTGR